MNFAQRWIYRTTQRPCCSSCSTLPQEKEKGKHKSRWSLALLLMKTKAPFRVLYGVNPKAAVHTISTCRYTFHVATKFVSYQWPCLQDNHILNYDFKILRKVEYSYTLWHMSMYKCVIYLRKRTFFGNFPYLKHQPLVKCENSASRRTHSPETLESWCFPLCSPWIQ